MSREVTFFVFRHGETDWNRNKRVQGHTDIPLNDLGREQAKGLAALMERAELDVIVTSDLARARDTAAIVNEGKGLPVFVSDQLRECHLGDFEGLYRDEAIARHGPDVWERWFSIKPEDLDFKFPGGETKRENLKRVAAFLEKFVNENPHYKRIGVSTHGGSLVRLIHSCEGAPEERSVVANCSVREMTFHPDEARWVFVREFVE